MSEGAVFLVVNILPGSFEGFCESAARILVYCVGVDDDVVDEFVFVFVFESGDLVHIACIVLVLQIPPGRIVLILEPRTM